MSIDRVFWTALHLLWAISVISLLVMYVVCTKSLMQ